MNIQELRKIPKAVLVWKMGSDATQDIITLVPVTGPIKRWMEDGFDFLNMPNTLIWFAPRFVELAVGLPVLSLFSSLDPNDRGYVNICIQQVMSVSEIVDSAILDAYLLDIVADDLKLEIL